jgi:hypothetical protein
MRIEMLDRSIPSEQNQRGKQYRQDDIALIIQRDAPDSS